MNETYRDFIKALDSSLALYKSLKERDEKTSFPRLTFKSRKGNTTSVAIQARSVSSPAIWGRIDQLLNEIKSTIGCGAVHGTNSPRTRIPVDLDHTLKVGGNRSVNSLWEQILDDAFENVAKPWRARGSASEAVSSGAISICTYDWKQTLQPLASPPQVSFANSLLDAKVFACPVDPILHFREGCRLPAMDQFHALVG
ncbi:hypothetical protein PC129_g5190 [Phytophthora cactorum]|uniref:Uncharacterized protein n=1 Tax=Phytophthora cactorum TaxID=29920 RepID=A0A8T1IJ51_9STRA|nr:hypothetical protein PC114_g5124 [Phytophthora cactorum]KAG2947154.1 hypothetical protein PC117_g7040 [Phytophthora cactorum]KAG3183483.1 hypothetical protein PC128_g14161 [Phytophthora cactorum]KAG3224183.1 hypothetical protein PC129_g5190 [Phytophthora cactorum]KAG4061251.1 hypothetical protein PC123_g3866 [Phytophthora cactorum]